MLVHLPKTPAFYRTLGIKVASKQKKLTDKTYVTFFYGNNLTHATEINKEVIEQACV